MKKFQIFLCLLYGMNINIPYGVAQIPQLERQVIAIGGSCRSNDNIDLCDNAGEVAVTTFLNPEISLYQGFEQGHNALVISTHEQSVNPLLTIRPNPVQAKLTVRSEDVMVLLQETDIYDVMGHPYPVQIRTKSMEEIEIEVSSLPSGLYFLSCPTQSKQLIIQKFIKI